MMETSGFHLSVWAVHYGVGKNQLALLSSDLGIVVLQYCMLSPKIQIESTFTLLSQQVLKFFNFIDQHQLEHEMIIIQSLKNFVNT